MITTTEATKAPRKRVNRSISFPSHILKKLKERAKKENRSVNFIVNAAVAKDNGLTY
jgi:hypothetical protein